MKTFLDTGASIAFLDRSDALHEKAKTLFASPPRSWMTSILVAGEAYGWFLHRMGEGAARTFRELLDELVRLTLLGADAKRHRAVVRKLDDLRGGKLTYVDASSLVWIGTRNVPVVWGTDHHLGLKGAEVTPGSPAL